jgi:ferrous iron transport protein B
LGGWVGLQALVMFGMYSIGIVTAVAVSWLLHKTLLRGEAPPFVMELPGYKWPSLRNVLQRLAERGWAFVRQAGTLIFAVAIVVWAAAYFPHHSDLETGIRARYADQLTELHDELAETQAAGEPVEQLRAELEQLEADIDNHVAGAYIEQSVLGRVGQAIEPIVKPLGWDWRIGCAVVASFPAREVVIGTLGVIYNLGSGQDEESRPLQEILRAATWPESDRPVFNVPVALSMMVFFALCAQCAATLAVIRRETNSWRWPVITFVYMTALAYVGALATYQAGMLFIS